MPPRVLTRAEGAVHTITLDRPGRQRNCLNDDVAAAVQEAMDAAESDPLCRVVVLRGSPEVFCSGMDFERVDEVVERSPEAFAMMLQRFASSSRVVVAAVEGAVLGGGVGLVAAADLAIAGPRASFALPEALWGLIPSIDASFLIHRVGAHRACELALSTRVVDPQEAARIGLIDVVADDLEVALVRRIRRFELLDGETIAACKAWFHRDDPHDLRAAVAEFQRLLAQPRVRDNIVGYAKGGRMPWERRPPPVDRDVLEAVHEAIAFVLGDDVAARIDIDSSFTALEVSPIDRTQIVSVTLDALGMEVAIRDLGVLESARMLAATLQSLRQTA